MEFKTLNLGFIGGGINSAVGATHKIAAQMDNRWTLQAGCFSTHDDINMNTAEAWGISSNRIYSSWFELLESEQDELDAIAILTPSPSHTEIVIAALKKGYAVICDKSLSMDSNEARQIKKVVEQNNGFLVVTYNYTGYPLIRELKQIIQTGKLGKIHQIHIEMPQEGFARTNQHGLPHSPQPWRLYDSSIPTISLDLGVHLFHTIDFLTNEKPIELVAIQDTFGHFEQIVDNIMCLARYTNNISCQIWYSKSAIGHRNGLRVQVFGENQSAEWLQMSPEILKINNSNGEKSNIDRSSLISEIASQNRYQRFKAGHPAGFIEAFANHYYDIADCLIKYQANGHFSISPWVFSVDQALEGLLILEAITNSANDKCWHKI